MWGNFMTQVDKNMLVICGKIPVLRLLYVDITHSLSRLRLLLRNQTDVTYARHSCCFFFIPGRWGSCSVSPIISSGVSRNCLTHIPSSTTER